LIGLNEQKIKETLKNQSLSETLVAVIDQTLAKCGGNIDREQGKLLYSVATKLPKQYHSHLSLLTSLVAERKIDQDAKLTAAIKYITSNVKGDVDVEELKKSCGVGVVVTEAEIEDAVKAIFVANKKDIVEQRFRYNFGVLLSKVKNCLKWADTKKIMDAFEVEKYTLLGPKTEEDMAKPAKKSEGKKNTKESKKEELSASSDVASKEPEHVSMADVLKATSFHAPGNNQETEGYVTTKDTERLLKEHLKRTGGQVRTRFPPEPNGILHIGHAKAININFGYAAAHNGTCYLRYDDTNPEKEEEKFFVGIADMVSWLGYKPTKVTHSSDYFDQLYRWAVQLIEDGHAYVCHQKPEEVRGRDPPPSPWRERPAKESLQLFEDMKNGKFAEGEATLRLKVTLEEGKVDPVAYRIKYVAHHRTGDAWCVYPTYDYTHCLCDSLEDITHSLCTKEFQNRRSSYYWLCNALTAYCPVQWEYGRLNMSYAVVSKRKIAKLIETRAVADWDDPRLFTLSGLRRRGFPAQAINRFCATLGLTGAQITIHPDALEAVVRDCLNTSAHRRMVVLDPIKVVISNLPSSSPRLLPIPNLPDNDKEGTYNAALSDTLFIDAADFRMEGEKGYRRLTPRQPVGLRHAGLVLTVTEVRTDSRGQTEIVATVEPVSAANKPKAFVHWVASPVACEVRLYDRLFLHQFPEDQTVVPDGYLSDINPASLVVKSGALCDASLTGVPPLTTFQFERVGFFAVDPDSTPERLVFNRTVGLKEDKGKN